MDRRKEGRENRERGGERGNGKIVRKRKVRKSREKEEEEGE